MEKLIVTMTAVAFAAGSLGFVGCGGIDEDPDAAKNDANEEEPNPDDEYPNKEDDGDKGESKFTPKGKGETDDADGDE